MQRNGWDREGSQSDETEDGGTVHVDLAQYGPIEGEEMGSEGYRSEGPADHMSFGPWSTEEEGEHQSNDSVSMEEETKENGYLTDEGYLGEEDDEEQEGLVLGNPPAEQRNQYIQELMQRLNDPSISGAILRRLIQTMPLLPALPGETLEQRRARTDRDTWSALQLGYIEYTPADIFLYEEEED